MDQREVDPAQVCRMPNDCLLLFVREYIARVVFKRYAMAVISGSHAHVVPLTPKNAIHALNEKQLWKCAKGMVYDTCVVDVLLKRKKSMAVKHPTTELIALYTKLPKGKSWAITVYLLIPNFLH